MFSKTSLLKSQGLALLNKIKNAFGRYNMASVDETIVNNVQKAIKELTNTKVEQTKAIFKSLDAVAYNKKVRKYPLTEKLTIQEKTSLKNQLLEAIYKSEKQTINDFVGQYKDSLYIIDGNNKGEFGVFRKINFNEYNSKAIADFKKEIEDGIRTNGVYSNKLGKETKRLGSSGLRRSDSISQSETSIQTRDGEQKSNSGRIQEDSRNRIKDENGDEETILYSKN